jgi:transposase-like protein
VSQISKMKDYQVVAYLHDMTESHDWMDTDPLVEAEYRELQAEIEKRGIRLTKQLVQKWWHKYGAKREGRMQWKKPRGYNNHWREDTVAVYSDGTMHTVYCSLAAIVADIGY